MLYAMLNVSTASLLLSIICEGSKLNLPAALHVEIEFAAVAEPPFELLLPAVPKEHM